MENNNGRKKHQKPSKIKNSIIYGDLPPEVRKMQYEQFINKENKVIN